MYIPFLSPNPKFAWSASLVRAKQGSQILSERGAPFCSMYLTLAEVAYSSQAPKKHTETSHGNVKKNQRVLFSLLCLLCKYKGNSCMHCPTPLSFRTSGHECPDCQAQRRHRLQSHLVGTHGASSMAIARLGLYLTTQDHMCHPARCFQRGI